MKKIGTIMGTLFVLALVLVVGVVTVGAQTDEDAPADPPAVEDESPAGRVNLRNIIDEEAVKAATADALGMTVEEFDAAKAEGLSLAEIAEAQGVDLEDVQAAVTATVEEMVLQAVEDGELTQEDADLILERLQDGGFFFGPGRRGRHGRHGPNPLADYLNRDDIAAATAGALGMTVEELQTAREDGQTIAEIAEAQGVDLEDVQAAVQEVYEESVAAALADGAITEDVAAQLLEREVGLGGFGPCHGGPGGPDGFGPGNLDNGETTNTLDA